MPTEPLADVFVPGRSRTKGSWTFVTRSYAKPSPGMVAWQQRVAEAVRRDRTARLGDSAAVPYDGPVLVELCFFLTRPPGDTSVYPTGHQHGDIDKLVRLVLDALKAGGAYVDDRLVVSVRAAKLVGGEVVPIGASILARSVTAADYPQIMSRRALEQYRSQGLNDAIEGGY